MKFGIAIISLFSWWFMGCKSNEHAVRLTLSYSRPYCNGARPTPDMEEAANQRHPFANQMFYFVNGTKVDSVRTDANGILKTQLKGNGWVVLEGWQYYKTAPDNGNMANYKKECLEEEWRKTIAPLLFTTAKKSVDTAIHVQYKCPFAHPCVKDGIPIPE